MKRNPILCRECIWFLHVPFTVGRCRKHVAEDTFPSIVDERAWPDNNIGRCGPDDRFFVAKEEKAA